MHGVTCTLYDAVCTLQAAHVTAQRALARMRQRAGGVHGRVMRGRRRRVGTLGGARWRGMHRREHHGCVVCVGRGPHLKYAARSTAERWASLTDRALVLLALGSGQWFLVYSWEETASRYDGLFLVIIMRGREPAGAPRRDLTHRCLRSGRRAGYRAAGSRLVETTTLRVIVCVGEDKMAHRGDVAARVGFGRTGARRRPKAPVGSTCSASSAIDASKGGVGGLRDVVNLGAAGFTSPDPSDGDLNSYRVARQSQVRTAPAFTQTQRAGATPEFATSALRAGARTAAVGSNAGYRRGPAPGRAPWDEPAAGAAATGGKAGYAQEPREIVRSAPRSMRLRGGAGPVESSYVPFNAEAAGSEAAEEERSAEGSEEGGSSDEEEGGWKPLFALTGAEGQRPSGGYEPFGATSVSGAEEDGSGSEAEASGEDGSSSDGEEGGWKPLFALTGGEDLRLQDSYVPFEAMVEGEGRNGDEATAGSAGASGSEAGSGWDLSPDYVPYEDPSAGPEGQPEGGEAEEGEAAGAALGGGMPEAAVAEAVETNKKEASGTFSVAYWNTGRLHVGRLGWAAEGATGESKGESMAARRKLAFLEGQLAAERATVLVLLEVDGSTEEWEGFMRKWLLIRGFDGRLVRGAVDKLGIAVAVNTREASLKGTPMKLDWRVVGVEVEHKGDGQTRRVVGMHGENAASRTTDFGSDGQPETFCFARQWRRATDWVAEGGVVVGDFNRVLCRQWRVGSPALSKDDRRMRATAGWRCLCCDGVQAFDHALVLDAAGTGGGHTHWNTRRGVRGEPTARLDYGMQFGSEAGAWTERRRLPPDVGRSGESLFVASDHAYMMMSRPVYAGDSLRARRPMPFAIGERGDPKLRAAYVARTVAKESFVDEANDCAEREWREGRAGLRGMVSSLVGAATEARQEVEAEASAQRAHRGKTATPREREGDWTKKLREACRLRAVGALPWHLHGTVLHKCRKLAKLTKSRRSAGSVWDKIVATCRRQLKAAQAAVRAATRQEDTRLLTAVQELAASSVDAVTRMQRTWRALREARTSTALEEVWEGDQPPREGESKKKMHYTDPGFKAELGRVGEAFVAQMEDNPACVPAFEAWCEIFMGKFEELRGADGEAFSLQRELTWEVFREVLYSMPAGKAVGAGGFHAELLRAAGEEVQKAFYRVMMKDLRGLRVPEEWKTVLYALLIKKPPSRPDVVSQRREIALMAHDMKLLLQMVRRVSYQRMVGRLAMEQAGWLNGYGCGDPAMVVASVVQQARRLKKPLWLLYIDLATFFPRIDRDVLTVAEAIHGLPKEVQQLTLMIYGAAAEPEKAVTCHYDSAAGLGDGFKNWMGALMGCVLSPDRAKLLLNTVLVAIKLVCKGVKLWGHGAADQERTWRRVAQAAFADDWCGCFEDERDLQKAWHVWRTWERVSGCKLGVKKNLKTVVTGAGYDTAGRATSVSDPKLPMIGGGTVPFITHGEAYKHLGVWRTACGDDGRMWQELKRMLRAALARLRSVRRVSIDEFILLSNALIGGIAGYYLQTFYISFEQSEEIEREWRTIFRRKFGGKLEVADSTPRVFFYQGRAKGLQRRQHLWAVGLEAIVASFDSAMADVDDTPQRAAARTTIALALEAWGCKQDPHTWSWQHLEVELERSLRRSSCRQLGDAWMLATCMLEQAQRQNWAALEDTADVSAWTRDFDGECAARWGRWRQRAPAGDPLHASAPSWRPPQSTLVSEPVARGGLGLEPEAWLLNAGVSAVGHMCRTVVRANGVGTHEWRRDYAAARRANPRLPAHGAAAAAWARQLQRLEAAGALPEAQERADALTTPTIAAALRAEERRHEERVVVNDAAVDRVLSALEVGEVRARRSAERWKESLERCFAGVRRMEPVEWTHGCRDRGREAEGARCVLVMDGSKQGEAHGGEARWLSRARTGYLPRAGDEADITIGTDGWVEGHASEAEALAVIYELDEEGYVVDEEGQRLEGAALGQAPPAVQMAARARIEVGKRDPKVIDEWPPAKRKETHVNLAVCRRNLDTLMRWQTRIKATAVYTLDGTRSRVGGKANPIYVCARAAIRHDGQMVTGRMREPEGADNYLAELAAQIDALHEEGEGGRIILVFDATSPVLAMRKFQRCCHRRRQGYYAGEWLETLMRMVEKQEVVVFLWQTSHVGSAVNEWADVEATAAARSTEGLTATDWTHLDVPRLEPCSASMRLSAARTSTRSWARDNAGRAVRTKLARSLGESLIRRDTDMAPLKLADDVQLACDAVLARRSVMGDDRRHVGRVRAAVLGKCLCPFGCVDVHGKRVAFTWLHAQMFCGHCDLVQARRQWHERLEDAVEAMVDPKVNLPHPQLADTMSLIQLPRTRDGPVTAQRQVHGTQEISARRCVGGCIQAPGNKQIERDPTVRALLVKAIAAGAQVQKEARRLTYELENEALKEAAASHRIRGLAMRWLWRTRRGGPARGAALRQIAQAAEATAAELVARAEKQVIGIPLAEELLEGLVTSGSVTEVLNCTTVGAAIGLARTEFPTQRARTITEEALGGCSALWQWKILALAKRWQLRAALRRRRRNEAAGQARAGGDGAEKQVNGVAAADESAPCELTQEFLWSLSGDGSAPGRRAPQIADFAALAGKATRVWIAGGGWKGEAKRRKEEKKAMAAQAAVREQQRLAKQRVRFETYMAQDGVTGMTGLSGNRLQSDDGTRIYLEISVRKRRRGMAHGRRVRSKARQASAVERGVAPNTWDMWRVERVMEVQRTTRRTRAGDNAWLHVKVRWIGPYRDSWMKSHRAVKVKGKMRTQAMLNAALMAEARQMEVVKYGAQAPPRGGGASGSSQARKRWRRWDGVLRGTAEDADDEAALRIERRMPKARRIQEDEEQAHVTRSSQEEAWADLRRQRLAGRRQAAGRRAKRRRVLEDSSDEESGAGEEAGAGEAVGGGHGGGRVA